MAKHRARPFSAKGPIKKLRLVVLACVSIPASLISAQERPNAVALVRDPRTSSSDGRLDERDWRDAPVLKHATISETSGAIPYETEVRIIVSNDRIFFGFVCKDPHPNRFSIHTMRRDEKRSALDDL